MLAVIDVRSSEEAKTNLEKYVDDILFFETNGITYNAISGHPDIFIFQYKNELIIAPNSPELLINFLKKHNVNYKTGISKIDETFENSVKYNCVTGDNFFLHKKGMTEKIILENNSDKKYINLPQAYTRCSMIHLKNNVFISSDLGIKKVLDNNNLKNFYFSPENIKIIDHKNGFLGGTCGVFENKIFFNGNIDKHKDGVGLRNFVTNLDYEIICLHDDFLYDGGGIFFVE
ncbi:MAG: hypothetical protein L3J35_05795 [Bacteroidales bacterium]|nr:hypothetical protein [Bacteroidales bacterium]